MGGGRNWNWDWSVMTFLGICCCCCALLLEWAVPVHALTDAGDMAVLNSFRQGLKNAELLNWPDGGNDPCGQKWQHVFCTPEGRISQIQVQNLGLEGPLPQNFNQLKELFNIGLQRNQFSGPLPTFRGLSKLEKAYLGTNSFDTIPADFFVGLTSLEILSLEYNNLNSTTGWTLPADLQNCTQMQNLFLSQTNLVGSIPEFLGSLPSLQVLQMAYNNLSGPIPSSFKKSQLTVLQLNNQGSLMLSGPLDVLGTMTSLSVGWLHGNNFNGTIPATLGDCAGLQQLKLNNNNLVGPIPSSLLKLNLRVFTVDNNALTGAIPAFNIPNFTYSQNNFCQSKPGLQCAPEVTTLLDFLGDVNYPVFLSSSWGGNDPCTSWMGISCKEGKVSTLNLPNRSLNGTISPSLANLTSLSSIKLSNNLLHGTIPSQLAILKSLTLVDLRNNNLSPPVPKFSANVTFLYDGNPLLVAKSSTSPTPPPTPTPTPTPPPTPTPTPTPTPAPASPSPAGTKNSTSPSTNSSSPTSSSPASTSSPVRPFANHNSTNSSTSKQESRRRSNAQTVTTIVVPAVAAAILLLLVPLALFFICKRKPSKTIQIEPPGTVLISRRDPSNNSDSMVKIMVSNKNGYAPSSISDTQSRTSSGPSDVQVMEAGNLVISVQVLRDATDNFSPENELGRGGFGAVYKGTLCNGTMIAVKRMEVGIISTKGLNEFQSEITVLSKVRHRNLVSLLGYSIEGNERLLVYEYMPQGALSKHIFDWAKNGLDPISWKRRLNIALDVARGMEYLHSLAHRSFIHRDLKPSNILLGDDYHAKVSDFGLVKLAPDGKHSIETRLAGTFGYLAPEYAVTGRITTKADVYSFGVVLMELITGRRALEENEPEESMHLVTWFRRMYSAKETLPKAIDRVLEVNNETFESICTVAELSGHCTAREPYQRPDMGHAVNVLAPLVEKWKPSDLDTDEDMGIDFEMSLPQALKKWQQLEDTGASRLDDSKQSLPTRPIGFADSFTSSDGR